MPRWLQIAVVVVLTVVGILLVIFSARGRNTRDFSSLGTVTSANLWVTANDGSRYGWKISDPKDLSRIVNFVDSQRVNWGTPWYGIAVAFLEVQLFDGQQLKSSFGVGKNFFETQRNGGFFSKNATPNEIRGFLDSLGLDEATVREIRNGSESVRKNYQGPD